MNTTRIVERSVAATVLVAVVPFGPGGAHAGRAHGSDPYSIGPVVFSYAHMIANEAANAAAADRLTFREKH